MVKKKIKPPANNMAKWFAFFRPDKWYNFPRILPFMTESGFKISKVSGIKAVTVSISKMPLTAPRQLNKAISIGW